SAVYFCARRGLYDGYFA
nr:immunoglobulin heavy chain junction region [Mus musculus]